MGGMLTETPFSSGTLMAARGLVPLLPVLTFTPLPVLTCTPLPTLAPPGEDTSMAIGPVFTPTSFNHLGGSKR